MNKMISVIGLISLGVGILVVLKILNPQSIPVTYTTNDMVHQETPSPTPQPSVKNFVNDYISFILPKGWKQEPDGRFPNVVGFYSADVDRTGVGMINLKKGVDGNIARIDSSQTYYDEADKILTDMNYQSQTYYPKNPHRLKIDEHDAVTFTSNYEGNFEYFLIRQDQYIWIVQFNKPFDSGNAYESAIYKITNSIHFK